MRPKNVLLEDFLATLLVQFEDDSRGGDSFPIQSRFDAYADPPYYPICRLTGQIMQGLKSNFRKTLRLPK